MLCDTRITDCMSDMRISFTKDPLVTLESKCLTGQIKYDVEEHTPYRY